MSADWYYRREDKTEGPVYREDVENLLQLGMIRADDLVWQSGMDEWVEANEVFDVVFKPASAPPPPPPPPTRPAPSPTNVPGSQPAPSSSSVTTATQTRSQFTRRKQKNQAIPLIFLAALTIVVVIGGVYAIDAMNDTEDEQTTTKTSKKQTSKPRKRPKKSSGRKQTTSPTKTEPKVRRPRPRVGQGSSFNSQNNQPPLKGGSIDGTNANKLNGNSPTVRPPTSANSENFNSSNNKQNTKKDRTDTKQAKKPVRPSGKDLTPDGIPIRRKRLQLYQDLLVHRRPTFSLAGLGSQIKQNLRYRVLSSYSLGPMDSDGQFKVRQRIMQTKLEQADPLSQATMASSLKSLVGKEYTFTMNKHHQVVKFTGFKNNRNTVQVQPGAKQKGLMMTSVMDQDGWKEIAQLTFFVPQKRARWQQEMSHDWGQLGQWTGNTLFQRGRKYSGLQEYNYAHQMKYSRGKSKKKSKLPLKITAANFSSNRANGVIYYDPENHRVSRVEENFNARGTLSAEMLGQQTQLQLEEQQTIQIRLSDENLWD